MELLARIDVQRLTEAFERRQPPEVALAIGEAFPNALSRGADDERRFESVFHHKPSVGLG